MKRHLPRHIRPDLAAANRHQARVHAERDERSGRELLLALALLLGLALAYAVGRVVLAATLGWWPA